MVQTATASSSSAMDQSQNLINFRELCHSLEAGPTTSRDILRRQLHDAVPVFRSCGKGYPGSIVSSKAKASTEGVTLASGKVIPFDEQQKALHKTISQLHQIDESEVAIMLRVFFDSDDSNLDLLSTSSEAFVSPLQQRSNNRRKRNPAGVAAGAEDFTTKFFDTFTAFFFEERLYIQRCISALIRIADDSFHDLNDVARETLDQFADQSFAQHCLTHFQQLCQQDLLDEIREVPRYSVFWSKHALREQLALLEVVFLLYYSRLDATAQVVKTIFNVIKETDFGREQACSGFFDAEASHLVDCVGSFLVLLCVESLELEKCMEGLDLHSSARPTAKDPATRQLFDAPDVVGEVVDFLQTSTQADVLRAPLLLSFALVLSRIDSALIEWQEARSTEPFPEHLKGLQSTLAKRGGVGVLWPDFVTAALTPALNIFGTLNSIVTSPLFRNDTPISTLYSLAISSSLALRAVFKGLVLSITQLIRPEYIQDHAGVIDLWKNTFTTNDHHSIKIGGSSADSVAALCAQFWETDFDHEERRAVLTMATRRFPVSFRPLMGMCQALSGGSSDPDDHSLRACTAVVGYLAQVNSLSQVMPVSPSLSLPYEPVESSLSSGTAYRATRSIPVFGKHLVIPPGTIGKMVSQPDQAPIVILWDMPDAGFSAWRLIRDVLASFVGLLHTTSLWKSNNQDVDGMDSAVFSDKDPIASFSALAPDEGVEYEGDVVADALNLLCSVLNGGRYLSATLLSHLNGDDIGIVDPAQPTAISPKPTLIDIALRILDQSLANPASTSRVILAALRLLTLLVPSASASIWQTMRSSNSLIGSSRSLPFSSLGIGSQISSTSLLSHEISTGQFAGTLMLLDFHSSLLLDLQRTQYSSSTDALHTKVEVMGRATHFIINHIWIEYQNWKYISIRQQIEMGKRCTTYFEQVCKDESLRKSPLTRKLVELVDAAFFLPASPSLIFTPLLRTISSGQRLISMLQRGMRQIEAELARRHLISSLRFALTIMQRQEGGRSTNSFISSLGNLESMMFDQSTASSSKGNLVKAVANLTLIPNEYLIKTEAVKMLTCLCRATTKEQSSQAPTLIGYLGSLEDVEKLVNGLLNVVTDSSDMNGLSVQTWNLLSSIVDTQPALATLLLTGRHLAASVERHLATLETESGQSTTAAASTTRPFIDVAKSAVVEWSKSFDAEEVWRLEFLEGALKFLNAAWKHSLEHQDAFSSLRTDQGFWSAISQLAQADAGSTLMPLPPTTIESIMIEGQDELRSKSDASESVCLYALKRMCAARALGLLTSDIQSTPTTSSKAKATARGYIFDRVMAILAKSEGLTSSLQAAIQFPCDALMHDDVSARLAQSFPEMSMEDFCIAARRDDYDFTRQFGDNYLYDIDQLQKKLQGFAPSVEEEVEGDETQLAALQQAVLLVAGLNLNWSIVDAQSSYLAAWTALLTAVVGPTLDHEATDKQSGSAFQRAALSAWIDCAKITSSEEIESQVTIGIHAERIALLSVLLKLCWNGSKGIEQVGRDAIDADGLVRDAMDQVEQILIHPLFRVEDAVRNRAAFPRQVFEMVYLCAKRYTQVRERLAPESANDEGQANLLRVMQQSAEALTVQIISCLRAVVDNSWALLSSSEEKREEWMVEADDDLGLLTSILSILLNPSSGVSPHVWSPRLQTTALLSTIVDLFSRSPMQQHPGIETAKDLLASGATPIYSQPLLSFFFDLASQRSASELLVLSGIINGLCNNSLSSVMDSSEEVVPPRLANTSYENPTHSCWLQMLKIVIALVANLEGPVGQRFVQTEAWSFFKVFEKKLSQSLDVPIRARAGWMLNVRRGEMNQMESIRMNQLEEVDLVLKLYVHIIRAKIGHVQEQSTSEVGEERDDYQLFEGYVNKVSVQLQRFVHLLQHPRELTALVGAKGEEQEEEEKVKSLLMSSCASIVSSLWEIGRGGQILCSESNDWDLRRTIISPTISTTPTSPSSTGTLLDLATYLVESILRSRSGKDKEMLGFMISTLEQTASLCTTQLVLAAYVRPNSYSTTVRKDMETGLGRDVKQGLESAKGAMQSAGQSTSFLDVLLNFHFRWLHGSD